MGQNQVDPAHFLISSFYFPFLFLFSFSPGPTYFSFPLLSAHQRRTQPTSPPYAVNHVSLPRRPRNKPCCAPPPPVPPYSHVSVVVAMMLLASSLSSPRQHVHPTRSPPRRPFTPTPRTGASSPCIGAARVALVRLTKTEPNFSRIASPFLSLVEMCIGSASSPPPFPFSSPFLSRTREGELSRGAHPALFQPQCSAQLVPLL